MIRKRLVVVDYDPRWPEPFDELAKPIRGALGELALAVEHVGSTSVPGLAAKPAIDLDVVVESAAGAPPHHLYACAQDAVPLRNHLAVPDHLRQHPDDARAYAALRQQLAAELGHDPDAYTASKTEFLVGILRRAGFAEATLAAISAQNQPRPTS